MIKDSVMASTSAGTPGINMNSRPASSIIKPLAVPRGLGIIFTPLGSIAWRWLGNGIFAA
jgi:hypothetical protein